MCEPTLILATTMGAMTAVQGISQQRREHAAAVDRVNRSNAIAKQDYLNKIQISKHDDQAKLRSFEAALEGASAEREALYKQRQINQLEADRASAAAKMELDDKIEEAQFKGQTALAESIRAQGTVLAGDTVGQSMLLEAQQAERELGFASAEIDAALWNNEQNFAMAEFDIALGKYAADHRAVSSISGGPTEAPTASFMTVKPLEQKPPKKPSILGPILSGVTSGFTSYVGTSGFR